ncbi:pyruvate carboxylase [Panacagrimonas perspica]|uniref:Pyruvate carboxylase n=1 Tax=Panacagrimonas perspica TaxID=381431 RepID=A0A4R7P3N8_9GAMM|nr:pyruvate carboxylase [Panacagrimonas perspica]TDU28375.1 pyruvate carboxylase [Panacagrimonas perspica]THD01207.1 pyruvate carboxylase [Panacagrimonas perspica]
MRIQKLLVANRGEISIRVMRAAAEMGIRTVAIYAYEDRFALHRFKADESYLVGKGQKPIAAYLDIADIIRIATEAGVDAIHPGYGFLSENPHFAEACLAAGIEFIGPRPTVLRTLGDKVAARAAAMAAQVPILPASGTLPRDVEEVKKIAAQIGYPVMLKASWGGGGRGMRAIESEADLPVALDSARREALAAFGNDEGYLEKLVRRARHVEVQILGDAHGNVMHLFERDCSVQRRNQKVVERAPAPYLTQEQREELCGAAVRLCQSVNYTHAGTVEFLMDADTGKFYFIEVNPRIQVEHTVTEEVTGVDIVKSQIRVSEGGRIGDPESKLPSQDTVRLDGHALQCRVTTEDPENGFTPDYGRLIAYRSPAGFGIRLDGGTSYSGAVITPYYDSLLVKVTAWAQTSDEAIARMHRALTEFRIRGLATNLMFVDNVIRHPLFRSGECTTRFIDTTPELFQFSPRKDRATKLLRFIGEVIVNGNPEMKGRKAPDGVLAPAPLPAVSLKTPVPAGTRDILKKLGPKGFADWMKNEPRVLLTDTTMRDAHQSLFATRMRSKDMLSIAPYYARMAPNLFSMECWGGATFDVALRFLKEDSFERLAALRDHVPNIPFQMLLRSANAVGYTNYADNVVKYFVKQAADAGVDIFRVFDSLNWVENMRVAMDAVIEAGGVCEGTICYTGDLFDTSRPKYNLKYYVDMAKQLEKAGAHVLGIKDMSGVCRPRAARELVKALKSEIGIPLHFHTHDTSGIAAASVLAAVEAGCDAVDGALDAMSGLTSQPNLGSIAAALAGSERDPGLDLGALRQLSDYWEGVRRFYSPFEADIRSGTGDVYNHEMPGGQYTNLREQARSLGLESRWADVSKAYADVNKLFGDIVKVTPSSKVVGDMALFMVGQGLTPADVADPEKQIDFPESVVQLFRGELGYPADGWPAALQAKVLKGKPAVVGRIGDHLPPVDLEAARAEGEKTVGYKLDDRDLASYLMYPKVFKDFAESRKLYGDLTELPTPTFFYGLRENEEISVDIDQGKTLVIRLQGRTEMEDEGVVKLFFELNGQGRQIRVPIAGSKAAQIARPKADENNPNHIGAPMPGMVVRVAVAQGASVAKGEPLAVLEAMKMETVIAAPRDARIVKVHVKSGTPVNTKDLMIELE